MLRTSLFLDWELINFIIHSMSKCLVLLLPYDFAMKSFINKADINMMKIRPIHVLVTVLQKSV